MENDDDIDFDEVRQDKNTLPKGKISKLFHEGFENMMKFTREGDVGEGIGTFIGLMIYDTQNGTHKTQEFMDVLGKSYPVKAKLHKKMLRKLITLEQSGISEKECVRQVQNYFKGEINMYKVRKIAKGIKYEDYSKDIHFIELNSIYNKLSEMKKALTPLVENSSKPVIIPELLPQLFDVLKDFFSLEEQPELRRILETGENAISPLLFKGNGSRLADAFKLLIESNIVTSCTKKELENWIAHNFIFLHRNEKKQFKSKYLNDIISSTKNKCRNPILNLQLNKTTGKYIISKL